MHVLCWTLSISRGVSLSYRPRFVVCLCRRQIGVILKDVLRLLVADEVDAGPFEDWVTSGPGYSRFYRLGTLWGV
jgi:hypothetical protein